MKKLPPPDLSEIDLGFDDDEPIKSLPSQTDRENTGYKVGKGKPPREHQFKPGNIANPKGAGAHGQMLQTVRRLSAAGVAEIGALVITSNLEGLTKIAKDPNSSALQVWMAAVAIKGIKGGDAGRLDILLNRLVGRVKENIELTGAGGGPIRGLIGAMSPEERLEELARLRKQRADAGED